MSDDPPRPLIGRETERTVLEKTLAELSKGTARVINIAGDPGSGKTRMLSEVAAIGRSRGVPVLSGRIPISSSNVPLAVLADALRDHISTLDEGSPNAIPAHYREALAAASPFFPFHAALGADVRRCGQFGCFRAIRALIEGLASEEPVVITLDDLERADAQTVDLLRLLLSCPPRAAVLLVLAFRERQVAPALRSAVETAPSLIRLQLTQLTEAQVGAWLGDEVSPTWRRALYQASDGNPAYLAELHESARFGPPGSADPEDRPVSRRFTTDIAAELSVLSPAAIRAAWAAAVVGDHFQPAFVQKVAGLSEADLYPALDQLAGHDLIRSVPATGDFAFRHPLVRLAIYQATGPGWRLAAHARAAALLGPSLAPAQARAPHLARVAGPGDTAAADVLAEAASVVERDFAAAAARWRSAALRLLADRQAPDERRPVLVCGLARALAAAGQPQQACDVLQDALPRDFADSASWRTRAVVLHARLKRQMGRPGDAGALLRAELSRRSGAAIGLELACTELMDGRFTEAAEQAQRVAALADRTGSRPVLAGALAVRATAGRLADHDLAAADILSRAAPMADALSDGDLAQRADCVLWAGWAETLLDRWDDALRHFDRAVALGRPAAEHLTVFYALAGRAMASCRAGHMADAEENAAEALDVSAVAGGGDLRRHALLLRTIVTAWDDGWRCAGRDAAGPVLPANGAWLSVFALNMLAEALLARGDAAGCLAAADAVGAPELSSCGPWLRARWSELVDRAAVRTEPQHPPRGHPPAGVPTLTGRERQVAELVSQGLTNRVIARRLSITEKTVEAHLSKVFAKLGATNRVNVARILLREAT